MKISFWRFNFYSSHFAVTFFGHLSFPWLLTYYDFVMTSIIIYFLRQYHRFFGDTIRWLTLNFLVILKIIVKRHSTIMTFDKILISCPAMKRPRHYFPKIHYHMLFWYIIHFTPNTNVFNVNIITLTRRHNCKTVGSIMFITYS